MQTAIKTVKGSVWESVLWNTDDKKALKKEVEIELRKREESMGRANKEIATGNKTKDDNWALRNRIAELQKKMKTPKLEDQIVLTGQMHEFYDQIYFNEQEKQGTKWEGVLSEGT